MRMRARAGLGAVITVVAIGLAASPTAAEAMPSTLYVFGDSLSDNGNLYAYTGQANPATGGLAIPVAPPYARSVEDHPAVQAGALLARMADNRIPFADERWVDLPPAPRG